MRTVNAILKKVYMAQRKSPCKGDWVNLVEEDLKSINIDFNEHFIAMVKKRASARAFA